MKLISEYVAPWALPKEEIPMHLLWEKEFAYDVIRVTVPSDLQVKQFFNVEKFTEETNQQNSTYLISQLKTLNFFGLTVASKDKIQEHHIKRTITIVFVKNSVEVELKNYEVNIFRPYVEIIESPSSIVITKDEAPKEPFIVAMKLSGFGTIQIRNEISTGGQFFERAEPLYNELIRKVVASFREGKSGEKRKGINIDPVYLQRKVKEFIVRIERNEFPLDVDAKDIEALKKWASEVENRQKIIELMSKHLETLIVDSLLFYFDRYPTDNIQMPQGKPIMFVEKATQEIRVRFRYKDAMLNEYEPIELKINVDDRRANKSVRVDIPININWKIEEINPLGAC